MTLSSEITGNILREKSASNSDSPHHKRKIISDIYIFFVGNSPVIKTPPE
jgi:hypothetical protein